MMIMMQRERKEKQEKEEERREKEKDDLHPKVINGEKSRTKSKHLK